jgi:hypothetical protein
MTSEGLGEVFEDDSADTKISAHTDGGSNEGFSVCRPGSADPHRRERIFVIPRDSYFLNRIMLHFPNLTLNADSEI